MHHLIDQHRAGIATMCRRYGVRRLEVFGSAARGEDFDPVASDADFLVAFDRWCPTSRRWSNISVLQRHLNAC